MNLSNSSSDELARNIFFSTTYNFPGIILVTIFLVFVVITTALGNLLVCLALIKYSYLRTISNYLIGNLALSDFLLATTILPLSSFNECLGHWIFGRQLCNAWLIMDALYCTASLWNICIIALDRFTATFYPMWYRQKRSTKQAAIYIALVWIVSFAICLPPVLGWNDLSLNYRFDQNQHVFICLLFETPSYVLYSACGSFYVPMLLTLFLYARIFLALKRKSLLRQFGQRHPPKSTPCANSSAVEVTSEIKLSEMQFGACKRPSESNSSDRRRLSECFDQGGDTDDTDRPLEHRRCIVVDPERFGQSAAHSDGNDNFKPESSVCPAVCEQRKNVCFWNAKKTFSAHLQNSISSHHNNKRRGFEQRELRATIRMAIIIGVFCCMWTGFFTVYLINGWCKTCVIPREIVAFFFWLGYLNSAANPILYTTFNHDFRRAFQCLLKC
uniref:Putative dopamine receptor 4 n=1 Tax=Hirudo verbana TaxID=311461 RepID=A0A2S1WLY5_9ANNE|nr:putative dopamine receptor 4 [Hirudo verbana]